MNIKVTIEPADALAARQSDEETLSHILSALYGRMGVYGWRTVRVELIPEAES
jgi:hypothetical protein